MPRPTTLGVPCDICGKDEYWDNRESKKNAKAPDWVCASKECPGKDGYKFGRWERDRAKWSQKPKDQSQGGRLTPDDTTPDERGERVFTWAAMTYTYSKLYTAVAKVVASHLPEGQPLDQNAVQAGVATLLIQGDRSHIPLMVPRPAKPEPKKVEREVPSEEEWFDEPGSLPF